MDETSICKKALKLFQKCLKDYANIDVFISDSHIKTLITNGGEGSRFEGPSTDIKFRYGIINFNKNSPIKEFYINAGNHKEESKDEYQKFEKYLFLKFKENDLPFFVFPTST